MYEEEPKAVAANARDKRLPSLFNPCLSEEKS